MKNVTGSNIKRLREARGLTQEALARELGFTRAKIREYFAFWVGM